MAENPNQNDQQTRTFSEELEVAGNQLVERVQDVIRQGNVRRLIIRTADDRVLMDTTLTLGAIAGGALAMVYWPLAAVAAIAAAVARVKVEVIREIVDGEMEIGDSKARIEIQDEEASS